MSKKVFIKRRAPFIHEQMSSDVMEEQMNQTKRSIGSYFRDKHSVKIGNGLTPTEENFLMPIFLGIDQKAPDFYKKVSDYFTEIDTKVPYGKIGLELEIGLADDDKAVSADNLPLNIENYIRYRHAIGSILCAASPEEAEGVPLELIWFYVEDTSVTEAAEMNKLEVADLALVDYAQTKTDLKKVKMIVSVMRGFIKKRAGQPIPDINKLSDNDLLLTLRQLAMDRPIEFHNYANDTELSKKNFINRLLDASILTRIGNTIVDARSNQAIGDNMKEVLVKLWSPSESAKLSEYISLLKAEEITN